MSDATSGSPTQPLQDARPNLQAVADRLRQAALQVLWRQWRAVGGQAAAEPAHALVDPEALVLLSLALMDNEPRLADILHDWAVVNSDLLSVQRVNNLASDYPEPTGGRLAWFARVALEKGKDLRWRALAARESAALVAEPRSSSRYPSKLRAIRTRLTTPSTLLLQLRLGFGVGAKADVLGFLLGIGGRWATVRDIAAATAYTVAAVRRAAEDMAAARLIDLTTGPPAAYRADFAAWSPALKLDGGPPPWRSWHERFAFVVAFVSWVETLQSKPIAPYALGVKGRELLEMHRPVFERDLVVVWSEHTPVADGAGFVANAVETLAQWMVHQA